MSEALAIQVPEPEGGVCNPDAAPIPKKKRPKKGSAKLGNKALSVVEAPQEAQVPPGCELVKVGEAEVLLTHRLPDSGGTYAESRKRHKTIFRGFTDPNRHG